MAQYVIATTKSWNIKNAKMLVKKFPLESFRIITERECLTTDLLRELQPRYVFFPHWSWIIPPSIFHTYKCVVFHMTDLPFGRGGSPLQNLIVRGIYDTKISAIEVDEGVDTGSVYFKYPINISKGNADAILKKISKVVFFEMIPIFLKNTLVPHPQEGKAVTFKRRTPEQSEIPDGLTQRQIYDFIRMLDGEGYPSAYKDIGKERIYFKNARIVNEIIYADVELRRYE